MSLASSFTRSIIPTPRNRPEFVNVDLIHHYDCPVCRDILKDCSQLPCGHKVCELCIDLLFTDSLGDGQCPINEEDCFPFPRDQILPDYGTRRDILRLKVYCSFKNNGCQEICQWIKLENHLLECTYRTVECPHKADGCEQPIIFKNLQDHIANDCLFEPISCRYCHQEVIRKDMEAHHAESCSQIEIPCKYCDIAMLPREQMLLHFDECPKKPAKCPYASVGCTFEGKESEVREHEQKAIVEHMTLYRNYVTVIERQNEEFKQELQVLKEEKVVMQAQYSEMKKDYETLARLFDGLKRDSVEFQLRIVSTIEKVFAMEELLKNVPSKQTVDQISRDLRTLKDKQEDFQRKLGDLESTGFIAGTAGRTNTDLGTIDALKKQVQNLERQTAIQDIRLAELDLRFQILETASYDGILIWKIMDYSRRKTDAVTGRTYSLFSQPFYTGKFGYKMCGRVYLNGDGMGKGSHLSLFFVIMKGEHDALMPWPFQQNIQMALLDQEGTQTVTDSFRPDTSSSSFQRPATDMNTAVGCPMFVSHTKLETRKYLKDDTIFIKIAVDRSGLPHH